MCISARDYFRHCRPTARVEKWLSMTIPIGLARESLQTRRQEVGLSKWHFLLGRHLAQKAQEHRRIEDLHPTSAATRLGWITLSTVSTTRSKGDLLKSIPAI